MDCQEYNQALTEMIRPQTHPLGIKILTNGDDVPPGFSRPQRFGIKISLCQWMTMARRWGKPLAALAEDINCSPCLAALGLKKMTTPNALADYLWDMGYFASRELAARAAAQMDPIPAGEIRGLSITPLAQATEPPDLVVIYGSPAQMARLSSALVHQTGEFVGSNTTGFGVSCLAMMKPRFSGKPALVVPGRGERILAGTEEGEMYCSLPFELMDSLLTGLEETQKTGTRYPIQKYVLYEPPEVPAFTALNQAMTEV